MAVRAHDVAAGLLGIFGLAFLLPGAFLIVEGVRRALGGESLSDAVPIALGGLAFAAFGAGALGLAFHALRNGQRLRVEHPDEPWRRVPGWAEGIIRSGDRGTVIALWLVAVVWNAVAGPLLFVVPEEVADGNHLALIGLIFPLVGLGLVVWAVRTSLRWRKFGTSVLQLAVTPAPVGGALAGTLATRLERAPASVRLRLTCVARTRDSDGDTHDSLLWHDEASVPGTALRREPAGLAVPFAFAIPGDARPTDRESSPEIRWRLEARAAVAGVDYASGFDVPVFRTSEACVEASRAHAAAEVLRAEPPPFDPREATISIGPGPRGGTRFRFGAARSPGAASGATLGAAVFGSGAFLTHVLGAPWLFPIGLGVVAAAMLASAVDLWLTVTTVDVGNDVAIRHAVLGLGRTRRLPRRDVVEVGVGLGRSQRERAARAAGGWYGVRLRLADGRIVSAGRQLRSRREAEWVASELTRLLG